MIANYLVAANIVIDNLDLQQMTSAFSFGRIEGRLSGQVAELRMLDWEPVAFDLDLYSEKQPGVRRRISQRAVAFKRLSRPADRAPACRSAPCVR